MFDCLFVGGCVLVLGEVGVVREVVRRNNCVLKDTREARDDWSCTTKSPCPLLL